MNECKGTTGGIKSIHFISEEQFIRMTQPERLSEYLKKKEEERVLKCKIASLPMRLQKAIKKIDAEIKAHERNAEEYYQELNNPEEGDKEMAKAELLTKIKNHIIG